MEGGVRGGGTGRSQSPTSCTMFSRLQYFCGLMPPSSRSPWYYSRLQVNKMDQKPGFWKAVPKRIIQDNSLAFHFFRGGEVNFSSWTSYRPGYHSLTIDSNIPPQRRNSQPTVQSNSYWNSNVYFVAFRNPWYTGIVLFRDENGCNGRVHRY